MTSFKLFYERVFHGTPNEFVGDFDLNHIGTGEGNQVFGWGLYFADNPKIAKTYTQRAGNLPRPVVYKGKTPREWEWESDHEESYIWEKIRMNISKEDLLNYPLSPRQLKFVKSLPDELFHKGNFYEVEINADIEDFIPYDIRVGEYDKIFKLINKGIRDIYNYNEGNYFQGGMMGNQIYPAVCKVVAEMENKLEQFGSQPTLNEQKLGTKFLAKVGVKGIRYLDSNSRTPEGDSYNYVVFDPSIIKIVSKNGNFVLPSKTPESVDVVVK